MLDVLVLPELRSPEQASGIVVRSGGSAANTAAWLAWIGQAVTFVGCAGDDVAGLMLTGELRGCGVVAAIRQVAGVPTGAVLVELGERGERVMRSSRGANLALDGDDIARATNRDSKLIHLTGYALLGPASLRVLHMAAERAREIGALLSFDPVSTGLIDRYGAETLLSVLSKSVNILMPSREEALALTGMSDLEMAASTLGDAIGTIVIKDGESGAYLSHADVTTRVTTRPLQALDTTGAGDAFNAGFLSGIVRGESAIEACHRGNAVAAECVARYGARPPSRASEEGTA